VGAAGGELWTGPLAGGASAPQAITASMAVSRTTVGLIGKPPKPIHRRPPEGSRYVTDFVSTFMASCSRPALAQFSGDWR
jgi:hypothetical protein